MKKSAMPEVKFQHKAKVQLSDAEIITQLRKENQELINKVDELRELIDELKALNLPSTDSAAPPA